MSAILMKCLLIRAGGTHVNIDGANYHFKDDGMGNHVCAISDMKHVSRLAGIPEAYEIFGAAPQPETAIGLGMTLPPVQVGQITSAPQAPTQLMNSDKPKDAEPLKTTANAEAGFSSEMTLDELRALFLAEVGREPSARAKPETLMAQITAVRTERAGQ